MKKFKYIISALLLVLTLCVPFSFTGCAKHYKITVTIAEGQGYVKNVADTIETLKSVVGENDVEEGLTFRCSVLPLTGYRVKYIKKDNVVVYSFGAEENQIVPDQWGNMYPSYTDVKANHSIVVGFEKIPGVYTVTFKYLDPATAGSQDPQYLDLMHNNEIFVITATDLKVIQNISSFAFKAANGNSVQITDSFDPARDWVLYTDESLDNLKALLGLTASSAE